METKRRPGSFRAIAVRICTLALALWLMCMGLLTWAAASHMHQQLASQTREYATHVGDRGLTSGELPGALEISMISKLGLPYGSLRLDPLLPIILPQTPSGGISSRDPLWGKWALVYGFEPAEIFYDEDGQILMQSSSYLTFTYTERTSWEAGNTEPLGLGYVDLGQLPGGKEAFEGLLTGFPAGGTVPSLILPVLRLTGHFEGSRFHPTAIDRGRYLSPEGPETDASVLSVLDARGALEWDRLFTLDSPTGQETETVYAWDVGSFTCDPAPITVSGTHFSSLTELLHADGASSADYASSSLFSSVIICRTSQEDSYGAFTYAIAVHSRPMEYAALRLIPAYLVSLGAVLLCVFLILRRISRSLTQPMQTLSRAVETGEAIIPGAPWEEPHRLEAHFSRSRQALTEANAQLQQTQTALNYARDAEENRRRLVSGITHELKTPIAVIHSYAEGLQTGIAGEKREHYLSVILEETERMDAMVLQMLDLSRLEAGKVRLAADRFSLLALARSVTDKFAPMLEAKGLELNYVQFGDFLITADEGRMEQAITNLVSNAIKYSPQNGRIRLKLFRRHRSAVFAIENTGGPLPEEVLSRVWDSFYRADSARTQPGTGLGLALVKSIVSLHRGECFVRNTRWEPDCGEDAVEFGFSIPMD